MTELYFSTVKILAQRPTHISAIATLLERERERERGVSERDMEVSERELERES